MLTRTEIHDSALFAGSASAVWRRHRVKRRTRESQGNGADEGIAQIAQAAALETATGPRFNGAP
jgi:hypothetical protein